MSIHTEDYVIANQAFVSANEGLKVAHAKDCLVLDGKKVEMHLHVVDMDDV